VKLACYRTNHSELERNFEENKNTSIEKKFLKINKTISRAGILSLKRTFLQKPSLSRKILQDSKNELVPNDRKKLECGNTDFQKKPDMEARSCSEALSLSEKLKVVNPLMIKSLIDQHPLLKTTNCMSNESSCRDTGVSSLKEHKSGWRRRTLCDDSKHIPSIEKSSGVSLKVSRQNQSTQQLIEKLPENAEILSPHALTFGISRKSGKPEKPTNTLNGRLLKVDKKEMFVDLHKISQESTVRFLNHFSEYEGSSERLNRIPTRTTLKSCWL